VHDGLMNQPQNSSRRFEERGNVDLLIASTAISPKPKAGKSEAKQGRVCQRALSGENRQTVRFRSDEVHSTTIDHHL
jgi:hypothetical protein